ncbi:FAD-binding protein [Marinovum sp. 2_MG-2023]|uniref:FAD-binding protein n=1 Tax=unclassified Marinovum TaxID=2647166 RepID=UPI0026E24E5A|nr:MULTISPECIES: FAD-binding protein [unclassified Marinovum]MDO6730589.1 FAD-binding protein [Marinovum sp. 2_MG-2023]MDO6778739.1 FAD-binding protein [Marinovum sp. 1_MG-2023]
MRPTSEAELAEMIAGADGPLRICGGGTRAVGCPVAGDILETGGLSGISLYEPGALTMVAEAGTPLADVEAALAAEGQRLAFEPGDWRGLLGTEGVPTLGGVVAANVSGSRRVVAGAARDFMLGVRFVDGMGQIVKNGGRVMKNVTGYDLVKLLSGSWGTLGVISEVSFKVMPVPEMETTLVCDGLDAESGVHSLCAALGTPFEVTGAAHLDAGAAGGASRTLVRIEGLAASVSYRAERLQNGVLTGFEAREGAASAALWRELRDVTPFAGREGAVWRVSVKPSDGPVLTAGLAERGVTHTAIYDWGGGLVWLLMPEAGVSGVGVSGAGALRQQVAALGGHATLFRGSQDLRRAVPVFEPQPAPLAALQAGLRAKFDPRGILNPGLMG